MNLRSQLNLILNVVVGGSFLVAAVSGVYLLFFPGGRLVADPMFLVSRTTWDMIHTWSGVVLVTAAVIHFAIHWRWIVNVSTRVSKGLVPGQWFTQPRQITGEG